MNQNTLSDIAAALKATDSPKHLTIGSNSNLANLKVGVVGAGSLAYALVCALVRWTPISATNIYVSSKCEKHLFRFKDKGCRVAEKSYEIFARFNCKIVFLCFHSSVIRQCYRLGGGDKPVPFTINYISRKSDEIDVLSLVSGVTTDQIIECLVDPEKSLTKSPISVYRLVINTSICYGPRAGLSVVCAEPEQLKPNIKELLSLISTVEYLNDERLMDNICTLSGHGLAICYKFASQVSEANLTALKHMRIKWCAEAMNCAAETVLKTGMSGLQLMNQLTSESNDVMIGIKELNRFGFESLVISALEEIKQRLTI